MEGHLSLLHRPDTQLFCTAHKIEYLWVTGTINFIGGRFVVPYFIRSNPGDSLCSHGVLSHAYTGSEYVFAFSVSAVAKFRVRVHWVVLGNIAKLKITFLTFSFIF